MREMSFWRRAVSVSAVALVASACGGGTAPGGSAATTTTTGGVTTTISATSSSTTSTTTSVPTPPSATTVVHPGEDLCAALNALADIPVDPNDSAPYQRTLVLDTQPGNEVFFLNSRCYVGDFRGYLNRKAIVAAAGDEPVIRGELYIYRPTDTLFDNIDVRLNGVGDPTRFPVTHTHMVSITSGQRWAWRNSRFYDAKGYSQLQLAFAKDAVTGAFLPLKDFDISNNVFDVNTGYAQNADPGIALHSINQDHAVYISSVDYSMSESIESVGNARVENNLFMGDRNGSPLKVGSMNSPTQISAKDAGVDDLRIANNTVVSDRVPEGTTTAEPSEHVLLVGDSSGLVIANNEFVDQPDASGDSYRPASPFMAKLASSGTGGASTSNAFIGFENSLDTANNLCRAPGGACSWLVISYPYLNNQSDVLRLGINHSSATSSFYAVPNPPLVLPLNAFSNVGNVDGPATEWAGASTCQRMVALSTGAGHFPGIGVNAGFNCHNWS